MQIVVAFLPVPPAFKRNSASIDQINRNRNKQVLWDIANIVLVPVMWYSTAEDILSGTLWPCSNIKLCRCGPISASGLADYMQHGNSMGVEYNSCPQSQSPKEELGSLIPLPDLHFYWWQSVVIQRNYWEHHNANPASDCWDIKFANNIYQSVSMRPVICMWVDLLHLKPYELP